MAAAGAPTRLEAAAPQLLDTQHEDHVHDVAWDYYARRLATCSSDGTVKIFAADGEATAHEATITGHGGPVWQVCWAHPRYGQVVASCGYDGQVLVHKEDAPGRWTAVHAWSGGEGASVNAVCWAPEGAGVLQLACAASDGRATILAHDATSGEWAASSFLASPLGLTSCSWCPVEATGSATAEGALVPRLATGGCDALVKVWRREDPNADAWDLEPVANGGKAHTGWVRDVAFSPFYGEPKPCLISCSDDKSVLVWTRNDLNGPWASRVVTTCDAPVWRVAWSVAGCVLAVSSGDDAVSLWKESVAGDWHELAEPEEAAT